MGIKISIIAGYLLSCLLVHIMLRFVNHRLDKYNKIDATSIFIVTLLGPVGLITGLVIMTHCFIDDLLNIILNERKNDEK